MIQPTGPLPPTVYWRRRLVALGGAILVVVLALWAVAAASGGEDTDRAASHEEAPVNPPGHPPPSPDAGPGPATSTPSSRPAGSEDPAEDGAPGSARPGTSGAPASSSAPPGPPPVCPDEAISVRASSSGPEHRVGQRPVLSLLVTNEGTEPCARDVNRELRELTVTTADQRTVLWSSNHCYSADQPEVPVLDPGEELNFEITWAGRTSEPGCPTDRQQVPAGDYLLVPRLGELVGEPVQFRLLP
ncbi:hypothetical protein C1701_09350 [Actinoalloteichus sp. AHMU CJ021]|uniref:DUF4232 family protein n=1 Tax=Actinoalloteichus caeruleus DSM 43889 TaxID=1120930 RepID=A0ABT1JJI5_ACTCY|nr:hypothetical protein [Actinoalloteichus caeruleus]AUS78543.1 hypothetical protein C1701_09350 [Actinoalloteichus sp. AHMU CJ021]MCP2332658.1 hypothetical protein [Actinoalloteichus caeruleus DSM 43889]